MGNGPRPGGRAPPIKPGWEEGQSFLDIILILTLWGLNQAGREGKPHELQESAHPHDWPRKQPKPEETHFMLGGAGLVACLDHAIAEPGTKIALSEVKLGILPAVIGPYVYRRLGSSNFRRLSMLASRVDASEALRVGFVDEVVETKDQFEQASNKVAQEVMTSAPNAISAAKDLVASLDTWNGGSDQLRKWTLDLTSRMRGSKEGQEGLSAFLEKREPEWKKNSNFEN